MLTIVGAAALSLAFGAAPAPAHGRSDAATGQSTSGLALENVTHGQLRALAASGAAILALADGRARSDLTFRRLRNFVALQRAYCLWGLVPGSLTDEASPFNECAHAYGAGLRGLLLHMQTMPERNEETLRLASAIETEMLRDHASLIGCLYSGQSFNTAEVIGPRWREATGHLPTLLALAGLGLAFSVVIIALLRPGRARSGRAAAPKPG